MNKIIPNPTVIVLAGINGAGKTTVARSLLAGTLKVLTFVNADVIAHELSLDPYSAAEVASRIRAELVARGESFAFETVFSDPAGEKVEFLRAAANLGINLSSRPGSDSMTVDDVVN